MAISTGRQVLNWDWFINGYFTLVAQLMYAEQLANTNSGFRFHTSGTGIWQNVAQYKAETVPAIKELQRIETDAMARDFNLKLDEYTKEKYGKVYTDMNRFPVGIYYLKNNNNMYFYGFKEPEVLILRDWISLMKNWSKYPKSMRERRPIIYTDSELR